MRPIPVLARLLLLAGALLALAAAPGGAAAARGPTLRVGTAQNATLDKRILVTRSGLSLYRLEGERNGRWLCTDRSCLAAWPPLLLRRDARPTGVRFLGSLRRPDGRRQVTYRGFPLYRYAFDDKRGDVRGDGVGDVAVWHVAVAPRR
jgi:predicted lipoprotein with Yx(FWY)xxD motif